jgi:hypothetical protein
VDGPDAERIVAFTRAGGALTVAVCRFPWRGPLDPSTRFASELDGGPVFVGVS